MLSLPVAWLAGLNDQLALVAELMDEPRACRMAVFAPAV